MWSRTLLVFLCLFAIGRIRTESSEFCSSNVLNSKMCDMIEENWVPCDNFYEYACGKYIDEKSPRLNDNGPPGLDVEISNRRRLSNFFKYYSITPYNKGLLDVELGIDLYKSCINRDIGLQPMVQLIESYGGWPVLQGRSWNESNWVGLNITKRILKENFNIDPILKFRYLSDFNIYLLELPTFGFNKNQLMNNLALCLELMVNVAVKFGATKDYAYYSMDNVISFELELVKIYDQPLETVYMTVRQMKLLYPALMKYLQSYVEPNVSVRAIALYPVKYFQGLELILKRVPDKTIANYLIWRTVLAASKYLTEDLYQTVVNGILEVKYSIKDPEWNFLPDVDDDECLNHVHQFLPVTLESMFIDYQFEVLRNIAPTISEIAKNIRNEVIKMVQESLWIDDEARKKIIIKLKSINFSIIPRRYSEDRNELNDSKLKLLSDNFLQNVLRIREYRKKHPRFSRYRLWEVDVEYSFNDNAIYILPGILRWPYFDINAPSFFNYGALGSYIGHLIGEVIYAEMHNLVSPGNSFEWLNSTENEYLSRVDCFRRQYFKIETEAGAARIGAESIKEDICDNVGVKAAYKAYLNLTAGNDQVISHGLWNYTYHQLFWISMVHTQCAVTYYYSQSTYTLYPHRVLGIIKNMPDFAKDFNCPLGSRMYSNMNERCELW